MGGLFEWAHFILNVYVPLCQERKEDNRISPQVGVVEGCQYKVVLCNTLDMEQIALKQKETMTHCGHLKKKQNKVGRTR